MCITRGASRSCFAVLALDRYTVATALEGVSLLISSMMRWCEQDLILTTHTRVVKCTHMQRALNI